MVLRVVVTYQGAESAREFDAAKLVIGRADGAQMPDLDLSADPCVSRQHATVQVKDGICWLSDLGSKFGTQVNGREIRAQGEWRLWPGDLVRIGETALRFSVLTPKPVVPAPVPAKPASAPARSPASASVPPVARPAVVGSAPVLEEQTQSPGSSDVQVAAAGMPVNRTEPGIRDPVKHKAAPQGAAISKPLDASTGLGPLATPAPAPTQNAEPEVRVLHAIDTNKKLTVGQNRPLKAEDRRACLLQDLALEISCQTTQDQLLKTVMQRAVEALPAARRGALVLRDPLHDRLLLKGYVSADGPAVSQTLVRRAMEEKRGFIWRSGDSLDPSRSMMEFRIVTGLYAPVQWRDQVFGVLCVDSPAASDTFTEEDLCFLIAVGQYAGLALTELQQATDLRRHSKLLDRLMANFSPKLRAGLLEQARQGKLRPGGVKSEVTILFMDLCGFTQQAAQMDSQDVVEMLNQYFQRLLETIFLYDGTVDKFLGDGVLAVFGSPEFDPQQHQKAIHAAVALQQALRATNQQRAARGDPTCQVRIALHCGEVFHGFVGTVDRLEFTVIGDAVNRASRYCQAAGVDEIVISSDLFQHVFDLVKADQITVATKEGELGAYRVTGLKA